MLSRLAVSFQYRGSPARLYSGSDAIRGLAREARRSHEARILVITAPSCVRAGLPERIREEAGLDFALFDRVERESPLPSVEAARDLAVESRSDLLIGVGGGSAVVTTRAVAILLRKVGHDIGNLLLPTTATTAVSRSGAAVLDPVHQVRVEHYDPGARPAAVVLEPKALQTAPLALFRSTAAASFCSAVELLTVPALHPLAFADAAASVNILSDALPDFVERPDDPDVRLLIGSAAFLAGRAADSMPGVSPGVTHALAHQLQVLHRVDQGSAMSSLIAAGLRYDLALSRDLEERLRGPLHARGSVPDLVSDVLTRAAMPVTLRQLSLERQGLRAVAESSMTSFFATHAPRPPSDPEDQLGVLADAW